MSSRPSSSSSSSWLVPFALGASTALSLVWISRSFVSANDDDKTTTTAATRQSSTTKRSVVRPKDTATRAALPPANTSKSKPQSTESNATKAAGTTTIGNSNGTAADTSGNSSTPGEGELMDSMELDHRLLRKAEAVLQWRTTRLVLVVERCTNDHNYSAILRTAEALGIQTVYMIDPPDVVDPEDVGTVLEYADNENELTQQQRKKLTVATPEELQARRMHHLFARKATEWLTVRDFASSQECVEELKELGYQLWVTDLSQHAESMTLSSPKIPEKIALVMGTEAVGCSQYMLDHADKRVYLPLRGFADSLNLSVATALILHQLFVMDPTLIGAASDEEKLTLRKAWYGKLCQQRILTAGQRKQRQKLQNMLKKCQTIHDRTQQPNALKLQPAQQRKLDEWDSYKEQLEELESLVDPAKVQTAIEEWVQNPPSPLTDVRRADVHRVCYVGKNTKTKHADDWKDMAATSNAGSIHMSSAAAFREKVKGVQ